MKVLGKLNERRYNMTIVKVATANPIKVEAIKEAFDRYFEDVEVIPFEVNSGVPRQPINEDVFKGAKNRIEELKKVGDAKFDFMVSCEGGLLNQYGYWFNAQVIMIERKDGKTGLGVSQGFQIPSEYIAEAMNGSIAEVLDRMFDGKGGIRMLTKGAFTRKDLIKDGTIMALTRVINGEIW